MLEKIHIRALHDADMHRVAGIHAKAFPESLITKLGAECTRRYYKWQLDSPDKVHAIGAFDEDALLGFCFGGVFTMALGGFIINNKGFIFTRILLRPWLLGHPYFIKKIYLGFKLLLKFSSNQVTQNEVSVDHEPFGILAIATDSPVSGVGRFLMNESERYAIEHNFSIMRLTVRPTNTNAIQFYEHIGWSKDEDPALWKGGLHKEIAEYE